MNGFRLLGLTCLLCSCSVVGPGEKGVRITLGAISGQMQDSGVYLWIPGITDVRKISVQIQKSDIQSAAATKDMQDVHAHVAVNWSVDSKDLLKTFREIGDEHALLTRIIEPAVNEVLKASTARRTAEEVLTKRMEMKSDIDEGLKTRLSQYGINLHDVSIVNLTFSPDFTRAIEQKQIAEQQAKQAEYVAQKATQDAKAEVERAKGQAEAQRLLRATMTGEILQQRAIDKWDGHFPQILGSNSLPFIDLRGTSGHAVK